MSTDTPIACSLGAADLDRRLAAIAELGADSLLSRKTVGGRYLLCFRDDAGTRGKLGEIVAAEAECCPFLDLALSEGRDGPVLSIAAPEEARGTADALAAAFEAQPSAAPSTAAEGVGSGRRAMRNELKSPIRPASRGMSSAT